MKRLLTLVIVVLITLTKISAQGSIKGKLMDTASKQPLGFATITVFKANDTALITYRLSNPDGDFKVPGLPLNLGCRVVISYSGYQAYRKEFTLTNETLLDLGTIPMLPSSQSLDEVLVIAERPPVTVKRDTIEFNASSFKTLPTALVEDLLKKLPGVQVDAAGNITANGKKVNRIMVDGKAFFGDDPKMATRNLPANVIDKVQVTDDKDEANRSLDGDLTNVGQVINLTLKKGVKKGWFGKAYAGIGNKDRYEIGGIANIYRDTMQLSVLAFSNNVNRSGFSFKEVQDLGGFNRSGFNSVSITTRGNQTGFALNGISFGGLDNGISRTTGAGFNLNHAPNKKKSFFLQYFFGNTKNDVQIINNSQQFFHDTSLTTLTNTGNDRNVFNHNASAGANLKPDTLTDINFRSSYSYATTDENIGAAININNNKTGLVSKGAGKQFNNTYTDRYNHNLFVTRRFKAKKGRTLNFYNIVNYSKSRQRFITESENQFYVPSFTDSLFNQMRSQDIPTLSVNTNLNFAEPLSKKFTLRFNNKYDFLKDHQDIGIYDKNVASAKYDIMDFSQSTGFMRTQNRFVSTLSLAFKYKKLTVTAGAGALWQSIHNEFKSMATPINMNLFNIVPSFSLNWKQLSAQINKDVTAPYITNLNPVPDSTNPFYIRYGNPYLRPARRTSFNISNYNFFQASGSSYNFYVGGSFINDDVIMSRTVAANGVQTVVPVNADGTVNFYAGVGFGKEYKNKQKFIFSFRVSPGFNFDRRKLIVNNNASTATNIQFGPTFNIGLNWNDIVEFRPQYSPGISKTRYTDPFFRNIQAITHYTETELIIRWPKKLVWETNLSYRYTTQVAPGLPKDNILWNAALTLLMFKGDKGLLKFSVFDILDRNNGFYRYTTQNQIVDQQTNVLKRFGELSFTYNIRNMGAPKKVGGRDRLFMF
jgi:hypothetical protein